MLTMYFFKAKSILLALFFIVLCMPYAAESKVLTIAYSDAYPPFASADGSYAQGIQIEILEEIFADQLGYELRHVSCPWKRCQFLVKNGFYDAFFTVITPERLEYSTPISIPVYKTNFVLHTSHDNPNLSSILEVHNLEKLVNSKNVYHVHMLGSGWHEEAFRGLDNVLTVANAASIPLILAQHRADVYVEQAEIFEPQVRKLNLESEIVTLHNNVMKSMGWHLFISKNSDFHVDIEKINDQLLQLQSAGILEEVKNRVFLKYGISKID